MRECMNDFLDLIKSSVDCIWINTYEESSAIADIKEAVVSVTNKMSIKVWSHTEGLTDLPLLDLGMGSEADASVGPPNVLFNVIKKNQEDRSKSPSMYILRDFHHLNEMHNVNRGLRDIKETRALNYCPIVVISPITNIPIEHEKLFTIIDYDLPSEKEVKEIIDNVSIKIHKSPDKGITPPTKDEKEDLVKACMGLTFKEITQICTISIVKNKKLSVQSAFEQKMQLVKKSGVLEYSLPEISLEEIGGNDLYKEWIEEVKESYTDEAIEFGVPLPKGVLHLGIPGTSKTLMAEALSSEMKIPLIKFDVNRVMDRFVGNSEKKVDQALRVVESIAPCVLLFDEIEKVLGGVSSSMSTDGGTLSRVFSKILEFMHNNKKGVFVVMTSNDVSKLPPELTRSGRLDAHWYFGLPNEEERTEIFKIHLKKFGKEISDGLLELIVKETPNYTGAEIEEVVKSSIRKAFKRYKKDGLKDIQKEDLLSAAKETIPLYKSSKENILFLESWSKDRARNTSRPVKGFNSDRDASLLNSISSIKI